MYERSDKIIDIKGEELYKDFQYYTDTKIPGINF